MSNLKLIFNPITAKFDFVTDVTGFGDVFGPASSTDNAITRYDGVTGKLIQNSQAILQDSGSIEAQMFAVNKIITNLVTIPTGYAAITTAISIESGGGISIEADANLILL